MKWFRFYSQTINDPKILRLSLAHFRFWVGLMCVANDQQTRGELPPNSDLALLLRMSEKRTSLGIDEMVVRKLVDKTEDGDLSMHHWDKWQHQSDDAAARMRSIRDARAEYVLNNDRTSSAPDTDTDTDTEQIQNRSEDRGRGRGKQTAAAAGIFKFYEQEIGPLTAHLGQQLQEAIDERHEVCIRRAISEAAEHNRRNWKYAAAILKGCTACTKEQCFGGARRNGTSASGDPYAADKAIVARLQSRYAKG